LIFLKLRQTLLNAFKLKEVSRAGWLNSGLKNVESVAAHSWGVSYLALILMPEELDKEKILSMSIFHDVGEAIIGDFTPKDRISKSEKHELEYNAIKELTNSIKTREKLINLWLEYEENISPESKFVKACDKLDMALQATLYSIKERDFNPSEFIDSALKKIDDECMRLLANSTAKGKN
tara:strand:- start:1598 stop:2134 length:537 start_codon:yes stop_codon:yes gene_type:complete